MLQKRRDDERRDRDTRRGYPDEYSWIQALRDAGRQFGRVRRGARCPRAGRVAAGAHLLLTGRRPRR